ncbi:hypothetical protein ABPG75_008246 [Micractinium tetrahymenae]
MDALPERCLAGPASPARCSPDPAAPPAPRAVLAADFPAACSDISDNQLLAITDTASLTADQLDRRHHLLRHSLPDEARGESVLVHFEAGSVHEAVKMIKKMSQRDLQAKFRLVYGAKTFSNNNNWLRRKLFEAIGVDPAKGAVKKAAAGGGGRRRRGATAPRVPRAPARASKPRVAATRAGEYELAAELEDDEDHSHVAEALLALGEAAAFVEDGFSEGSVPSSVSAAEAEEPTPASATPAGDAPSAVYQEEAVEAAAAAAAGGSAAFRRLLLEQHEAAQAAQAAAAAGVAEWIAAVQQHAAAAGGAEEAAALAAHMRAAAAAHLQQHPMLAGMGLLAPPPAAWPAAGYGLPMMAHQPAMLGALRHFVGAAQQQQAAAAPPLFAAAK